MKTYAPASPGGGSADAAEWFSVEELETARENYLTEQEKELPSPQVVGACREECRWCKQGMDAAAPDNSSACDR